MSVAASSASRARGAVSPDPLRWEVVVFHKGPHWWPAWSLNQARLNAGRERVTLIGDAEAVRCHGGLHLDEVSDSRADEFARSYVHMSSNDPGAEIFCWQRWIHLLAFMRQRGLERVVHFDSDVLLESPLDDMTQFFDPQKTFGLVMADQSPADWTWCASGHVSFWTRGSLEAFVEDFLETYRNPTRLQRLRDKHRWHMEQRVPGGICDMTSLYLFANERSQDLQNLAVPRAGAVVDNNMRQAANFVSGEYRFDNRRGLKHVHREGGRTFFETTSGAERVRVHALHFQGRAKRHMRAMFRGTGRLGLEFNYLAGRVAGRLKRFIPGNA